MRTFTCMLLILSLLPITLVAEESWPHHEVAIINWNAAITHADYDLDGDEDIIEIDHGGGLYVWENDGSATFAPGELLVLLSAPWSTTPADMDNDGDLDLVVSYSATGGVKSIGLVRNNDGDFILENIISDDALPNWSKVVDKDNDGDLDIYSDTGVAIQWLINDGSGQFTEQLFELPVTDINSLHFADIDNDGDLDYFMNSDYEGVDGFRCFINDGNDNYTVHVLYYSSCRIKVVQQDGEQYADLFIVNEDRMFRYRYNGVDFDSETVSLTCDLGAGWMEFADFDLDGIKEIAVFHYIGAVRWYQRLGDDDYQCWQIDNSNYLDRAGFFADLDGDGDEDFAATGQVIGIDVHLSWWENPDYQTGVDVDAALTVDGTVELSWVDLNASQYLVRRNGQNIALVTENHYTDQLPHHVLYEYTVTPNPQLPDSKPSYPCDVFWPDVDNLVVFADFDNGLPPSWTIEEATGTHTWEAGMGPSDIELELFDSPCMFIGTDYYEEGDWKGRLQTGTLIKGTNDRVEVGFDHISRFSHPDVGKLMCSLDNGVTWTVVECYTDNLERYQYFELTDELAGATEFKIGFDFWSSGYDVWAIDNVLVSVQEQPLVLALTPQNTTIPEGGGTLVYDAGVISQLAAPVSNISYWIEIELPTGDIVAQTVLSGLTLPAFGDLTVPGITLTVPANAPAGDYVFTGRLGKPNNPSLQIHDSFGFTKQGNVTVNTLSPAPDQWVSGNLDGWFAGEQTGITSLPRVYELAAPHPNPFNPTTTVSVALPTASDLHVAVYNTLGQTIATLASRRFAAGKHQFVFDGSQLSSGVYFVHAVVPGELNQTRKIVLMK